MVLELVLDLMCYNSWRSVSRICNAVHRGEEDDLLGGEENLVVSKELVEETCAGDVDNQATFSVTVLRKLPVTPNLLEVLLLLLPHRTRETTSS